MTKLFLATSIQKTCFVAKNNHSQYPANDWSQQIQLLLQPKDAARVACSVLWFYMP